MKKSNSISWLKATNSYGREYYYNPELDGIPKPKSTELRSNEFHPQNINSNSKHKQFLTKSSNNFIYDTIIQTFFCC